MSLPILANSRTQYGQAAIDIYTPAHFALGFGAGYAGVSPIKAALGFTVLKIAVAAAEKGLGHALFRRVPGESNINELCDLLAEIGGIYAGAALRARS
jgi:hypothetical protein